MTDPSLPLLLDPAELTDRLDNPSVRVIDLSPGEVFAEHHAPGACHLPYGEITLSRPPVGGLVPDRDHLCDLFTRLGIDSDTHVVAMDAEGGGAAGRLLWTLELLGHARVSLLDGGLRAWVEEGYPIERGPGNSPGNSPGSDSERAPTAGAFKPHPCPDVEANARFILDGLGRGDLAFLDARTSEEYSGQVERAARGGHIPGAIHFEWTRGMARDRSMRMREPAVLREELDSLGLTPDREIVTYCHTHHRSAFSYAMLRILGFRRVRGYPGSWSDWGNRDDTPVETA